MKYLQDYMKERQEKILEQYGAFFAFSGPQFIKQAKEGVDYRSLGGGLICPVENAQLLIVDLQVSYMEAIDEDMAENGKENVIRRELDNNECWLTGSLDACVKQLRDYPITDTEILEVFSTYAQSQN